MSTGLPFPEKKVPNSESSKMTLFPDSGTPKSENSVTVLFGKCDFWVGSSEVPLRKTNVFPSYSPTRSVAHCPPTPRFVLLPCPHPKGKRLRFLERAKNVCFPQGNGTRGSACFTEWNGTGSGAETRTRTQRGAAHSENVGYADPTFPRFLMSSTTNWVKQKASF